MEFILNRYRNLTVLVLVIGAQLLMLAYQVKSNQDVRLIRVWAVTAVTPLARILEVVRRNTIGIVEDYFVLINVRDENNRLREENGKLKMDNQFLRTELQTADRARALQAFQSRTPSTTLAARIIGNGTGTNSKVVFIDRGSSNGVVRGMAVVTPDGIVGKVLAAYPTASQVLLVTDPTFAAGVISEKNRVHGTLKGMGQSKCKIDYVQNEEKVDVGEMFYTSGDDRVFPKGLPVGSATVVRQGQTFKDIFLVPSGTQNGLEEVLVVIEGVHQAIPDPTTAVSSTGFKVLAAPPMTQGEQARQSMTSVLSTEADRLKDKYRKIGEAQNHVFGEGGPGSRPPNFNVNPDEVKPKPPAQQPAAQPGSNPAAAGAGAAAAGAAAGLAPPAPAKPKPPVTTANGQSTPSTTITRPPGSVPATQPSGNPTIPLQRPTAQGTPPNGVTGAGNLTSPNVQRPQTQGTPAISGATQTPTQRPPTQSATPNGGTAAGNPTNSTVQRPSSAGGGTPSSVTQRPPTQSATPNGATGSGNPTNSTVQRPQTQGTPATPGATQTPRPGAAGGGTPSSVTQRPPTQGATPNGGTGTGNQTNPTGQRPQTQGAGASQTPRTSSAPAGQGNTTVAPPKPASPKPASPPAVNSQTNSADPSKTRPAATRPNGEATPAQ